MAYCRTIFNNFCSKSVGMMINLYPNCFFMRLLKFSVCVCALLTVHMLSAQNQVVYRDAPEFPFYGRIHDEADNVYGRLPLAFEEVSRTPVWRLGCNSAGIAVRFRTNSTSIHVKWESLFGVVMNHMAPTGIRGLDLYALEDGCWRFVNSARPAKENFTEYRMISNMTSEYREFILYLSLYDGVKSLEIGGDEGAVFTAPEINSPRREKPLVFYGSSILQGGCVTRPGMAFTSIISRELDREVFNLGFSGNAMLDMEIAEYMTEVKDPGVFVLDYVPNCTADLIDANAEKFFRIIRDAHPEVPVIFVELPYYPSKDFDRKRFEESRNRNAAQRRLYEKLKKEGERKLLYIESDRLLDGCKDATVDGVHYTDIGSVIHAETIMPVIRKALKMNK